jgi:FkbM family methyltransferase
MAKLMQIRLSLSKIGGLVCARRRTRSTRLRSLGGDVVLRSHTSDISVLSELVVSNAYLEPAQLIAEPRTVVDLGANTGLAARWFLNRWPAARVVAVEPEPGNLDVLRLNLRGRRAHVMPVAVGGVARRATLHSSDGEFAFTICGDVTGSAVEVSVVTMGDVISDAKIDHIGLLKVDIEGAERELFADCGSWIDCVQSMIVECHAGYSSDDLLAACLAGGASFRLVDLDRKPDWGFEVATAVRTEAAG